MFRFCSFSKPSIRDWKNSLLKFCKWNWPILGSLVHAVSQTNRKVHRNRKTNKSKGLLQSPPTFSNTTKIVGCFFFWVFFFTEINSQMWEDHQKFLNQEADWAAGRSVKNMQFACISHSQNMCRKRRGLVQLEHLWSSRNNLVLTEKCLQIPQILHGCWWTGYHQGRGLSILSYIIT